MILPEKLKIGGREYRVVYPFKFLDTPQPLYGLHDASGQVIKIAGLDEFGIVRHENATAIILLHEMIHAIDNIYNGGKLTQVVNGEEMIDQLAEGFFQVLRDNKLDFSGG